MLSDSEESVGVPIPDDSDLSTVSGLVDEQLRLEADVEKLENQLKVTKEALANVQKVRLPEALAKFNLSEMKLVDGTVVTVKDNVRAGITEEHHDAAFAWLTDSGHDDIIKNQVDLTFGKGQDDEAKQLMDLLNDRGYSYQNKRSVHPSTLKAFVKNCLEDGVAIPFDLFSVYVEKIAKIDLPRKR